MLKKSLSIILTAALVITTLTSTSAAPGPLPQASPANTTENITIEIPDWKIWPSEGLTTSVGDVGVSDADAINPAFSINNWRNAKAPSTVLGSLVDDGYYDTLFGGKDVYYDDNLYKVPVADFAKPWWYRATIKLPGDQIGKRVLLTFEGINYAADIYVNGASMENKHNNVPESMLLNYDSNGNLGPNGGAPVETGTGAASIMYNYSLTNTAGAYSQCYATMQNHKVWENAGQPLPKYNDKDYNVYSKQFIGALRTYEIDVTDWVRDGEITICVKVQRPFMRADLFWSWLDWHTMPPDNNMGLIGKVAVSTSNDVRISNPFVSMKVSEDLTRADMNLYVDLSEMAENGDVAGTLNAAINKPDGSKLLRISKGITVPSGAYSKEYALTYKEFPELSVANPELWWPHTHGDQPLYTVDYEFVINGVTSGSAHQRFGIREIQAEITTSPLASSNLNSQMLQVYVNHKPVLLQGAGVTPVDILWRSNDVKNKNAVDYAKYMGFNMLRDEGKFDRRMIDYMDEQGVLLMIGWCCCDRWEAPGRFNKGERFMVYEGLTSLIRFYRQHPAFINMANGSDQSPGVSANGANGMAVQYGYFTVEGKTRLHETATIVSGSSAQASIVANASSGMHMGTTYDYQPPKYYFKATHGVYGFVSEGGGDAGIPVIETLKKILPNDQIWPYNVGNADGKNNYSTWNVHACRGRFAYFDWSNLMIDNHYGTSDTLEQFIMRAQLLQYDSQRANQEAVSLHRYKNTTGHVLWMYNNPWPGFYWNTYDNLMNPHGATYGIRKGNEPVHILYDAQNKDLSVVNSTQNAYKGVTANMWIYDIRGNVIGSLAKKIDIDPDTASAPVDSARFGARRPIMVGMEFNESGVLVKKDYNYYGQIMEANGVSKTWTGAEIENAIEAPLTSVYFMRLELKDSLGKVLSYNSYALATKDDETNTPSGQRPAIAQLADYTKLNELPVVDLDMTVTSQTANNIVTKTVVLKNDKVKNNNAIAYAVELKTRIDADNLVAPVFYEDNLFTLFPGETRVITITYDQKDVGFMGETTVEYTCYNNVCNPGNSSKRTPNIGRKDMAIGRTGGSSSSAAAAALSYSNGGGTRGLPIGTAFSNAGASLASSNGGPMLSTTIEGKIVSSLSAGCWANTVADTANPWFYADLGSVQSVDRINLRWSYAHRPDKVVIEVSDANTAPAAASADWKEAAVWNNPSGSSFSDIVFDTTQQARFIRIKPTGHRGAISARGVPGPGIGSPSISGGNYEWNGAFAMAAMTQFALISFEAYAFGKSVFLDIAAGADTVVKVNDDKVYRNTDSVNNRLIPLSGDTVKFTFISGDIGKIAVFRGNTNITALLDKDDSIVLSDVLYDETISVRTLYKLTAKYETAAFENNTTAGVNANLIMAVYDKGRLVCLEMKPNVFVDGGDSADLTFGVDLAKYSGCTVKYFAWSDNFVPFAQAFQL